MNFNNVKFGSIEIDGRRYEKDIVIEKGEIKTRDKKASKAKAEKFGHTPLTARENIPWDCEVLVIGMGHSGALPVAKGVFRAAEEKKVILKILDTPQAVEFLSSADLSKTNAVLHLTC